MDTATIITSETMKPVVDALQTQISAGTVVEVLAYIAGIAVLGVFLWWGVRKASKGINSAFLRGKLRL